MSVFGVDFGNLNSCVGVTRAGGIDIILNEVSKRETSAYCSFADKERFIGEGGLDRCVRNANNTICCLKRWIGMRVDDPNLALEKRFLSCNTTSDEQGRLQFEVNYNNDTLTLYPEQALAMFIQQLRKYVNREATTDKKNPADVRDCVLTVPCFYTAEQRKLVHQACEMAGAHCMSLINETTAASVDYGIFRGSSLPEKESDAQVVAIMDFGYGTTTIAITAFWRGNLRVLSRVYDKNLGTREIDYVLVEHFAKVIRDKYKIDVMENKRARIRLLQGVEKVRYLLSGNQSAPLNIENLMDVDVNINNFLRADMEELCHGLVVRVQDLLRRALAEANVGLEKIHSCEIIGGGCRIPFIKKAAEDFFEKVPSFTLNASESVARGAAITAAVFSPKFQVREFVVNELSQFPVKLGYFLDGAQSVSSIPFLPNVNKVVSLLGKGDHYPKVLEVTIKRPDGFTLYAFYDPDCEEVQRSCGGRYVIGEWVVGAPAKPSNGEVKVRVRFLPSGIVTVDGASTQEVYEVEETEEKKDPENPEKEAEKVTVKKQKQRKMELTVTPNANLLGHTAETIIRCRKLEEEMNQRDLIVVRTKEAKNGLESYILDNRARICGGMLQDFVTPSDRQAFQSMADQYEAWLYEDGEDADLKAYTERSDKLRAIGDPAMERYRLWDDLPFHHNQFLQRAPNVRQVATNAIGKFAHITEAELNAAAAEVDAAVQWAAAEMQAYQSLPKTQMPTLRPSHFDDKLKQAEKAIRNVLSKPVPKPETKSDDATAKEEKKGTAEQPPEVPPPDCTATEESSGPEKPAPADLD